MVMRTDGRLYALIGEYKLQDIFKTSTMTDKKDGKVASYAMTIYDAYEFAMRSDRISADQWKDYMAKGKPFVSNDQGIEEWLERYAFFVTEKDGAKTQTHVRIQELVASKDSYKNAVLKIQYTYQDGDLVDVVNKSNGTNISNELTFVNKIIEKGTLNVGKAINIMPEKMQNTDQDKQQSSTTNTPSDQKKSNNPLQGIKNLFKALVLAALINIGALVGYNDIYAQNADSAANTVTTTLQQKPLADVRFEKSVQDAVPNVANNILKNHKGLVLYKTYKMGALDLAQERGLAHSYDQATTAIIAQINNEPKESARLIKFFEQELKHRSKIYDAYYDNAFTPYTHDEKSGSVLWIGIAAAQHTIKYGDKYGDFVPFMKSPFSSRL
jgi:hypothetical protein